MIISTDIYHIATGTKMGSHETSYDLSDAHGHAPRGNFSYRSTFDDNSMRRSFAEELEASAAELEVGHSAVKINQSQQLHRLTARTSLPGLSPPLSAA